MREYSGGGKSEFSGKSFYFHDYETFGINPKVSAASQFAGIRTDENLNIIEGTELNIYCKPREDQLPSPMACIVTRLTPQRVESVDKSVLFNEYEFTRRIMDEMTKSNTCNIGYNSVSFDDEWSRNLAYRNFINPYEREWKNGCSRADGLFFIQAVYLYNPNILNFPQAKDPETGDLLEDNNGNPLPSFKLEELSAANGIIHENAHDALSDVIALIGLLKIIKDKDPNLFNYVLNLSKKNNAIEDINVFINQSKPFLHVSSFYGKKNNSCSVVYPIGWDKNNKNNVFLFDLNTDPNDLLLDAETLKERLFMKNEELEEQGLVRIGLKNLTVNKCPVYFPLDMVKDSSERLGLKEKSETYKSNLLKLKEILSQENIREKLNEVFKFNMEKPNDPDLAIYGGFPSRKDQTIIENIPFSIHRGDLNSEYFNFEDPLLNELFLRFKARNFKEQLSESDLSVWNQFIYDKLFTESVESEFKYDDYKAEILELKEKYKEDLEVLDILKELEEYGENKFNQFGRG